MPIPPYRPFQADELLRPAQVAELFQVNAKTITRWANNGELASTRTQGGQRRYWRSDVVDLMKSGRRAS